MPRGEQKQVTLPDGTTAYLNSGTLLVYPQKFTGDLRSVYLIGEANFDVKKDKQHPFIVKTNHLKVKVLGTKFNVHALSLIHIYAPYIYTIGAGFIALAQVNTPVKGKSKILKRMRIQQI